MSIDSRILPLSDRILAVLEVTMKTVTEIDGQLNLGLWEEALCDALERHAKMLSTMGQNVPTRRESYPSVDEEDATDRLPSPAPDDAE